MAVKIRLTRRGRKKLARYDVVIADARSPRDGKFIEKIGLYNPNTNPATIEINEEKAFDWVMKGAQPTDSVRAMLSYKGIMLKKHLQLGVNKGAITQEAADKKFEEWKKDKEAKIQGKVEGLEKSKADKKKAALEAEAKVSAARADALKKKKEEAEAALVAEVKEASAEVDESLEEDAAAVEEAQAETSEATPEAEAPAEVVEEKVEEAPAEEVKEEEPKAEAPAEEAKAEEAPAEE
ncbi:MAG: 30S ribosomal protein S16, partial [Cyclobacteriaceae bacterium]